MGLSGNGGGLTENTLLTTITNPTNGQTLVYQDGVFINASAAGGGGGSGTVTSISVVSANGFFGTVANSTTTPAITIDVLALDAAKIADGTVTSTEFQYINTLTSNAQTQINTKVMFPAYVSNYWYLGGMPGQSTTTTNTTPLVDDVTYAVAGIASAPVSITAIGARTSSTNASVAGAVKIGIYAADGTNGAPGTRLALTTAGVAIGDSATSTLVTWTLDATAVIPPGTFWVVFLQDSTTGVRFTIVSTANPQAQYLGATASTIFSGTNIVYGYTGTASYATGLPATFGTATVNSTRELAPAFIYEIE